MSKAMSKHEYYNVPLGEIIENRARAMYPEDGDRRDAFKRGATWAFDVLMDDHGTIKLKVENTRQQ